MPITWLSHTYEEDEKALNKLIAALEISDIKKAELVELIRDYIAEVYTYDSIHYPPR